MREAPVWRAARDLASACPRVPLARTPSGAVVARVRELLRAVDGTRLAAVRVEAPGDLVDALLDGLASEVGVRSAGDDYVLAEGAAVVSLRVRLGDPGRGDFAVHAVVGDAVAGVHLPSVPGLVAAAGECAAALETRWVLQVLDGVPAPAARSLAAALCAGGSQGCMQSADGEAPSHL